MKRKIFLFLLGALCFTISQPLLRIPLLNYLQTTSDFILFYSLNPLLVGILIAFSAGIFEEGFRFIFRRFLFKPISFSILDPILFGLGHGLTEASMVLLPIASILPLKSLYLPLLERFLAVILHIGLSLIIWNGFQVNKKYLYLGLTILLHGLVNSLIPLLTWTENYILLIEGSLALIDIFVIIYVYRSKKHYNLKEDGI